MTFLSIILSTSDAAITQPGVKHTFSFLLTSLSLRLKLIPSTADVNTINDSVGINIQRDFNESQRFVVHFSKLMEKVKRYE